MKYTLEWTPHFTRSANKFSQDHPDLRKRFAKVLSDLEQDPLQPHLRLHPLKGELKGMHAVSINYSYRITLTLKITENEIILIDVGSHDEVY